MATDLSKFLLYTAKEGEVLDVTRVASFKNIERYIGELRERGVGPSGIIGKLNVIMLAQSFALNR